MKHEADGVRAGLDGGHDIGLAGHAADFDEETHADLPAASMQR